MTEEFREHDHDLNLLVARIGALYTKQRLSPPFRLKEVARRWRGISHADIIAAVERHFREHRWRYTSGAGEQHFRLLEAEIQKAWNKQHPNVKRKNPEPRPAPERNPTSERDPKPERRNGVRKIRRPSGIDDAVDNRNSSGLFDNYAEAVDDHINRSTVGYEESGIPFGDDDA